MHRRREEEHEVKHEFGRVAWIATRSSRWLREKICNLLKCGRQEELLWVSVDQEALERNISAIWKTEGPTPQQGLP